MRPDMGDFGNGPFLAFTFEQSKESSIVDKSRGEYNANQPNGNDGNCRCDTDRPPPRPFCCRDAMFLKNMRRDQFNGEQQAKGYDDKVIQVPENGDKIRDQVDR